MVISSSHNAEAQWKPVPPSYSKYIIKPTAKNSEGVNSIEFSMNYNYMLSRSYYNDLKKFHDTSIEVKGWNEISMLDVYWSWSISNFMQTSSFSNLDKSSKNYQYGVIAPRLSLGKIAKSDLSFSFINDWFIAYRFEFDSPNFKSSNMLKHNIGVGANFAIPLFMRFKVNIYARNTEKNFGMNNYSWNGYLLSADYLISVYKFKTTNVEFLYQGWLDFVFGAKTGGSSGVELTNNSIKWINTFKFSFKGFAIGYTYQFNMNPNNVKYSYSDTSSQSVGLSYTINF